MPIISPTPGDVHVSRALTNMSLGWFQSELGFIADKMFPSIPSEKQADIYWVWTRDFWNRDEMKERAPGAESAGISMKVDRAPFYAPVYAIHHPMPDQVVANSDLDYDGAATRLITLKALLRRETAFITAYWNAAAWGVAAVGAATTDVAFDPLAGSTHQTRKYWSDPTSTPIEDIRSAMTYVQLRSGGFRPNVFGMGRQVADVLFDHPDVIARVNAGQTPNGPAVANEESLARILGLARVVVMDGVYNAAAAGVTENNQFFGGKSALLVYAPAEPNPMTPSGGYTFNWTGYTGAAVNGTRIKRWYSNAKASTIVEGETAFSQQLTSAETGYFFQNIVL